MEYQPTVNEETKHQISDNSKNYFTMIPNMLFDLNLSVYGFRLYCLLKKVAGDKGQCWMSTRTLAEKCQMGIGSVSRAKEELEKNGLIHINKMPSENGFYHLVEIIDIWGKNTEYFTLKDIPSTEQANDSTPIYGGTNFDCSTGEQGCSPQERHRSHGERINNHIKNNPKTRASRTKEEILEATKVAYEKSLMRQGLPGLEGYPEEIKEILFKFCQKWNLKLPARSGKNSQKAYWIESGRELLDACSEFGTEVLDQVRVDFERYMSAHRGLAPYTVSSPRSLVNPARAKAGEMRGQALVKKSPIPHGASEVWIGGQCYKSSDADLINVGNNT